MDLRESILSILREEYGGKYILYRGVGLDEAIKSCETGHLVYYSRDPMSRDWEVIEYGLGSEASEMSEEEVEEYVNDLVSWKRKSKGVNLTSDLDNAKGYSDIVLEINLVGYDYAEFSDVHIFAKNPEDCKIKSVYYNGKEYSKEEFLDITKSLQESIKKILREELGEYSRTLKNARKQGSGLRFSKVAVKNAPLRFRPYNRETLEDTDPKVGTGKKPEGSGRRLYTDENPSDTVSVKFRTKEDIVDTLNKESFKSKSHKRQSQIINLIHQRVRAAYQNAKDPETKKRLKRGLVYIENEKEKSKQKTIQLQRQEQNEGELTEKCWAGYEKKGMKTMFGKRYPNCVKKTK